MMSTDAFVVASAQGDYRVESFGRLDDLAAAIREIEGAFVVADRRVTELYGDLFAALGDAPVYRLPATEGEKTLAGVERVMLWMQAGGAGKRSVVVGIGGGIVQDVATLAAHLWFRGVEFVFVPTTLLAMADSCIGAKSAVNLGAFKNQIGTFHSPARVLTCPRFVDTLDDDDVRSGYGEMVKLAIIDSAARFAALKHDVQKAGFRGAQLEAHVRASLQTKRRIIEADEYEHDQRRILNYGHTFGHALEAVTGHAVPHGLAVAWGVDAANFFALRSGYLAAADYAQVHPFLAAAFRLRPAAEYDAARLTAAMRRDKKAASGSVNLILPYGLGDVRVVPTPLDARFEAQLDAYLRSDDIFAR